MLKRKHIYLLVIAILCVGVPVLYNMYSFSKGVVEDAKRIEALSPPEEFTLSDSTVMLTKGIKDSIR